MSSRLPSGIQIQEDLTYRLGPLSSGWARSHRLQSAHRDTIASGYNRTTAAHGKEGRGETLEQDRDEEENLKEDTKQHRRFKSLSEEEQEGRKK